MRRRYVAALAALALTGSVAAATPAAASGHDSNRHCAAGFHAAVVEDNEAYNAKDAARYEAILNPRMIFWQDGVTTYGAGRDHGHRAAGVRDPQLVLALRDRVRDRARVRLGHRGRHGPVRAAVDEHRRALRVHHVPRPRAREVDGRCRQRPPGSRSSAPRRARRPRCVHGRGRRAQVAPPAGRVGQVLADQVGLGHAEVGEDRPAPPASTRGRRWRGPARPGPAPRASGSGRPGPAAAPAGTRPRPAGRSAATSRPARAARCAPRTGCAAAGRSPAPAGGAAAPPRARPCRPSVRARLFQPNALVRALSWSIARARRR